MVSYLKVDQYDYLYNEIMNINLRIHTNGTVVDSLEKKLLEILKIKEEKKKKGETVNTLSL